MTPPEVRYDRLEQILAALPVLEDRREDIADEAHSLWFLSGWTPTQRSPRLTPDRSECELLALIKLIEPLAFHISCMHPASREALQHMADFFGDLNRMKDAARGALERLRSQPAPTGRPPKLRADAVATGAATAFEHLTGKKATLSTRSGTGAVSGPFLDFLREVFAACNINASAEAYARAARRKLLLKKGALTPFE